MTAVLTARKSKMSCNACGTELERDSHTGNFHCPAEDCGEGGISSKDGITLTMTPDGSVLLQAGKPN